MRSKTTDADILHPYQLVSENQEMPDGNSTMFKPSVFQRIHTGTVNILSYVTKIGRNFSSFFPNETEKEINQHLKGYPRNHNYVILQKKLIPSFKLYERLRLVTALYPKPLKSFIDIGCCRGFYALHAANRPSCNISVGVDVYEPFVHTPNMVREYLGQKNSSFYMASLDSVSSNPEAYGGPFQTVLLIGLYHYLFWGSNLCSDAYGSHHEILRRLSRICTDRLIFSGRLEIDQLPRAEKEKAKASGKIAQYNTDFFLRAAEEFFEVHKAGFLGAYPLFVMEKKNA